MQGALFPNWSNPALVAALVGVKLAVNIGLLGLVIVASGRRSKPAALVGSLIVVSTVLTMAVLRPGEVPVAASYAEMVVQFTVVGASVVVVSEQGTRRELVAAAVLSAAAGLLMLLSIVLYGEATVAP